MTDNPRQPFDNSWHRFGAQGACLKQKSARRLGRLAALLCLYMGGVSTALSQAPSPRNLALGLLPINASSPVQTGTDKSSGAAVTDGDRGPNPHFGLVGGGSFVIDLG